MSVDLIKTTCDTIGCRAPATHVLTWRDRDTGSEYTENVCEPDGMMYTYRPALSATLTPMAETKTIITQSGYTACACRDCMDTTVSSDVTKPELCLPCKGAGCEIHVGPEPTIWHPGVECQREDAYGDDVGDAGTGHGSYEYHSGA